jgi:hypothetical protein
MFIIYDQSIFRAKNTLPNTDVILVKRCIQCDVDASKRKTMQTIPKKVNAL